MSRVFIFDPEFNQGGGHHFSANCMFAKRVVAPVTIFASRIAPSDLSVGDATVIPAFASRRRVLRLQARRAHIFGGVLSFSFADGLQWTPQTHSYAPTLGKLLASFRIGPADKLVVHSGNDLILDSLAHVLLKQPARMRPTLHYRDVTPRDLQNSEGSAVGQLVRLCAEGTAYAYYETDAYGKVLRDAGIDEEWLTKIEFAELCEPVDPPALNHRLKVAVLGAYRNEKGPQRLPQIGSIYNELAASRDLPPIEFVIHTPDVEQSAASYADLVTVLERSNLDSDYSVGDGEGTAYIDRLLDSHMILLPYQAVSYSLRGSGLGCDAIANGRVVVAQGDCAVSEYVRGGNGLTAKSDKEFAEALAEIASDYQRFHQNARTQMQSFRKALDQNPLFQRLNAAP
ncbi:MAG: hypothetical protein AAFY99_06640 [Pseudomonadota bacterium]